MGLRLCRSGANRTIAPCVQARAMVCWQDCQGPLAKVVGIFGRKLERNSVHPRHYKPAKFLLFIQDTFDPVTLPVTHIVNHNGVNP